jgi:hypothetical protein
MSVCCTPKGLLKHTRDEPSLARLREKEGLLDVAIIHALGVFETLRKHQTDIV